MERRREGRTARIIAFTSLSVLMLIWILPMAYAIFTSFKSETEIRQVGFQIIPNQWTMDNYVKILSNTSSAPMLRWYINSLVISVSHTALTLLIVSMTAFGYSRVRFWGRDALFYVVLSISMFPSVVGLIPQYKIVGILGWVNRIVACVVPGLSGVGNVFLVRQFMKGIPMEYDESARIDGANNLTVYWHVILPLVKPVMTVVALFTFTASWNDFLWPSIVFSNVDKFTVTIGLELMKGLYGDYMYMGQLMAATVLALLPTLLIFLFAQKYFIQSMSLSSGVKG